MAVQGSHTNSKKQIKDIFYEKKVNKDKPYIDKWYVFSNSNGEVLAKQFCRFYFFDGEETSQALSAAGFKRGYEIVNGKFLVSYK